MMEVLKTQLVIWLAIQRTRNGQATETLGHGSILRTIASTQKRDKAVHGLLLTNFVYKFAEALAKAQNIQDAATRHSSGLTSFATQCAMRLSPSSSKLL